MKIQITSYVSGLPDIVRLDLTKEIINTTTADILLFSGHTIGFVNDIETLRPLIKNKKTEIIFELENINSDKISNCLYRVTNGKITSLFTNQLFTQSSDIEGNYELANRLVHEFETNRSLKMNGYSILIIQCGEINILKNIQSEGNKVEFRLPDDHTLENRFKKILKETNIILNPIHTPMGNQGKMQKRREYISKNKRYYFSASNTKKKSKDLDLKSLQYAFFDGIPLNEIENSTTKNSISRVFEIR